MSCNKTYFVRIENTYPLLNSIEGTVDDVAKTIELFFPYPFLILAVNTIDQWDTSPPVSEIPMNLNIVPNFDSGATTNEMIQKIFSIMMYANRDYGNYTDSPFLGAITYEPQGIGNYPNYFKDKLNDKLKVIYYNQFLYPQSAIRRLLGGSSNPTIDIVMQFCQNLYKTSDLTLWMAPGKYTIKYGTATPQEEYPEVYTSTYTNIEP